MELSKKILLNNFFKATKHVRCSYAIKTKLQWNPFFNPLRPNKPLEGPSELYTNVEEVKVDWKNIERLMHVKVVPAPPKKELYSSGWVPPKGNVNLTYHVRRTKNHMLPVYFVNPTIKALVRVPIYTTVKNVEGDIWALQNDLKEYLEDVRQHFVATQVHEVSRWIKFKGDHEILIKDWLVQKGL